MSVTRSWRVWSLLGSAILVVGMVVSPGASAFAGEDHAHVCSGTPMAPGVLAGHFEHGVIVKGACEVNGGYAVVDGDLTVTPGSALIAAFANNDVAGKGVSRLIVWGDVFVQRGATLLAGCFPTSFPCIDDPNQMSPTLSMAPHIGRNLTESSPLGVVVHDAWIGGDVSEFGGGGGVNCNPSGIFAVFQSPVYSDYEDSTVRGDIRISSLRSCWLGIARVHVRENVTVRNNHMADPDAIEIISNNIRGDLACSGNVTPANATAGNSGVWDSADPTGNLFPRAPLPNAVHGDRFGNCKLASPTTPGGPLGPGRF
jgi:hypothetical protein